MYGIYFNMPEDEYHAQEGLSSTGIKEMLQSPTNFWFNSVYNPNYKPKKANCLEDGKMFHCLYLEGRKAFEDRYIVIPGYAEDKKSRAYKNWLEDEAKGRYPITFEKYNHLITHAEYVNQWIAPNVFTDGYPEVSIFWEEDGIPFKMRIDYLRLMGFVDLKTFEKNNFKNIEEYVQDYFFRYAIYIQLRLYERGLRYAVENKLPVYGTPEQVEFINKIDSFNPGVFFLDRKIPNSRLCMFGDCQELWQIADKRIKTAKDLFIKYRDMYGMKKAWIELAQPIVYKDVDFHQLYVEKCKDGDFEIEEEAY